MTIVDPVQAPNYHRVELRKGNGNGNEGDPPASGANAQARARQSITLTAALSTLAVPFRGLAARRRKARPKRDTAPSWGSGPPSLGALMEQTREEWRDAHGRDLNEGESWLWRDLVATLHALFGFLIRVPGGAVGHAVAWVFQEEYRFAALLVIAWFWL